MNIRKNAGPSEVQKSGGGFDGGNNNGKGGNSGGGGGTGDEDGDMFEGNIIPFNMIMVAGSTILFDPDNSQKDNKDKKGQNSK